MYVSCLLQPLTLLMGSRGDTESSMNSANWYVHGSSSLEPQCLMELLHHSPSTAGGVGFPERECRDIEVQCTGSKLLPKVPGPHLVSMYPYVETGCPILSVHETRVFCRYANKLEAERDGVTQQLQTARQVNH